MLLDQPENPLWRTAALDDLTRLLGYALDTLDDPWPALRERLAADLPAYLRERPDYTECPISLRLDVVPTPGPD